MSLSSLVFPVCINVLLPFRIHEIIILEKLVTFIWTNNAAQKWPLLLLGVGC